MPGALTQTKERRVYSMKEAADPKERVLSGERTRPVDPAAPAIAYDQGQFGGPSPYVGPSTLPGTDGGGANFDPTPTTLGSYPIGGGGTTPIIVGGGGGGGSGGGGSGSGGGSNGGGGTTPGVDGALPEPGTWLSLMIGFFAIGFGLRGGMTGQPGRRLTGRVVR